MPPGLLSVLHAWEPQAAPQEPRAVPPGLPSMLYAQSLGLCPPGASDCVPQTPLCAPCPGVLGCPPGASGCAPWTPLCAPCPGVLGCPPGALGCAPWTPLHAPCPEPRAAPQEPQAVPPGLPSVLHAREPWAVPPGLPSVLHARSLGLCPPGASGCAPGLHPRPALHAQSLGLPPRSLGLCPLDSPPRSTPGSLACAREPRLCRAVAVFSGLQPAPLAGLESRVCVHQWTKPWALLEYWASGSALPAWLLAPARHQRGGWPQPPFLGSDLPAPQGCSSCAGLTLASAALPVLPDRPVREGEERLGRLQHRRPQVGGAGSAGGRGRVLTASALPESIPGCTLRRKTICRISHSIAYSSRN